MTNYKLTESEMIDVYKAKVKALLLMPDVGFNHQLKRNAKPLTEGLSAEDISKVYNLPIEMSQKIMDTLEKEKSVEKNG